MGNSSSFSLVWYLPLMALCPRRRAAVIMLVVMPSPAGAVRRDGFPQSPKRCDCSPMKKMTFLAFLTLAMGRTAQVAVVVLPEK